MIKKLIGRFSRWVRRTSDKYCTIDIDEDAQGLAKCLVRPPLTKKERIEKHRQQLLQNVDDCDKDRVIKHFGDLGKETDPLGNTQEIPDDSVKRVGMNISVEDVVARSGNVSKSYSVRRAKDAIDGHDNWPVPPPTFNKTKRKK